MAKRCGLSIATTHRLLSTLEGLGAVIHAAPGEYRIGTTLFRLTDGSSRDKVFAAASEVNLRHICKNICETAHFGILDSDFMVTYLAKAARHEQFPPTVIGSQLEAYCSGLGKVLLAALPDEQRANYLSEGPFVALTSRTITDPNCLMKELNLIAIRGYAVDDCEMFEALRCVAVPVMDASGKIVAALSASSDPSRMPEDGIPQVARALTEHARAISSRLFPSKFEYLSGSA